MPKFEITEANIKKIFWLPNEINCPIYSLSKPCKGMVLYDANTQSYVCNGKVCQCKISAEEHIRHQAEMYK